MSVIIRRALLLLLIGIATTGRAEVVYDLGTATLTLDDRGASRLTFADGAAWPKTGTSALSLRKDGQTLRPQSVQGNAERIVATFPGNITAEFAVMVRNGFAAFRLTKLSNAEGVETLGLFRIGLPAEARVRRVLNAATVGTNTAALMACEPNVRAFSELPGAHRADRAGCRHTFGPTDDAKAGQTAARFTATADEKPGGWSMRGSRFDTRHDLTGLTAIRAWVHGDGQGQMLKFQLCDEAGGCRDTYLKIDFTGWKQVTLTDRPYDKMNPERVAALQLYYNSLPAGRTVTCLIDHVEAIVQRNGQEQVVLLEDFESESSPFWDATSQTLCLETLDQYGLTPAAFGVVACPDAQFWDVVPQFEVAAGLPSPRLGGQWNKRSPWVKRSYLFLTRFGEDQFDEALAIAKRGNFDMILLGQESWCEATGHYAINRNRFSDGLPGLQRVVRRFKDEGFHVGLHFLGPSIYPPDPYLTPVPDPRLVKGASAELAAAVSAEADFLPLTATPDGFPAEDGGYVGDGTVLQIGDELIHYDSLSTTPPFGFRGCRRGHLGTKVAVHPQGATVRHLRRAYGYHMFDMNTTLLDEVATNFAAVANACDIDMIYFDGSERLQGDHWYYNARLHKAFHDRLKKKDVLLQASSFSHYSWHLLARSASADGHGDLKGYLEERSPAFGHFALQGMPMDVGWYYGYDPMSTLDQYEYVLGTTLGYGASMSFQVSVDAAARHPFTAEILDLIHRYEQLRLSGRVPREMRKRLQIDPILAGVKTPEEREKLLSHRRDYRLLGGPGKEVFQRVLYEPWRDVTPADDEAAASSPSSWTIDVPEPSRVGFQVHLPGGPWLAPGASYDAADALTLESFEDLAPFTRDPNDKQVRLIEHGQGGSTFPGVTQRMELHEDGHDGDRFAVYTAESTLGTNAGWSVLSRSFATPVDLSWHAAIGLWLRGDGQGGKFKLQLGDGKSAMDYYLDNTYEGWRYHQLVRPETDAIDYRSVRTLMVYYNGLPGKTTVSCGIDGVKALRKIDRQTLAEPWIEIDGQRLAAPVTLGQEQYLVVWPSEPIRRYGPTVEGAPPEQPAPSIELAPGRHTIRFGHAGRQMGPMRIRATLQTPERHAVP